MPPFFLGGGRGSFSWDKVTVDEEVERTGGVEGSGISCSPPESPLVSIQDGPGIGESQPVEGRLEGWGGGSSKNCLTRSRMGV